MNEINLNLFKVLSAFVCFEDFLKLFEFLFKEFKKSRMANKNFIQKNVFIATLFF